MKEVLLTIVVASLIAGFGSISSSSALTIGDILVTDVNGTKTGGSVFVVDPSDGARTILSNFLNLLQGPTSEAPAGIAIDAADTIIVTTVNQTNFPNGAVFKIDPNTGFRTILSNFTDATQGPLGFDPTDVAIESNGDILVVDVIVGPSPEKGLLFSIDPNTGFRTILSNFTDAAQGPRGFDPVGLTIESNGDILVVDSINGTDLQGTLFRIDPSSGQRTVLSDFGDPTQGPVDVAGGNFMGGGPNDVAVASDGTILVIDGGGIFGRGVLFSVNPVTGQRTVLSNFTLSSQGPTGNEPTGVAIEEDGNIVVTDVNSPFDSGVVFRVDPSSGQRTVLSNFTLASQGPTGNDPVRAAIVNFDFDGDGILNNVDTQPSTASADFSDAGLGGTTTGTITSSGDQKLRVSEEANPEGVRAKVVSSSGSTPATIEACSGIAMYSLNAGDEVVITCSSVITTVVQGPVEVTFVADSLTVSTSIDSGNTLTFDDEELTFSADSGNSSDIILQVDGDEITLEAGETVTLEEPEKEKNNPCDALEKAEQSGQGKKKGLERAKANNNCN